MNNDPKQTVLPDVGNLWRLFLQSRKETHTPRARRSEPRSAKAVLARKKRRKMAKQSRKINKRK